jgi:hypothetical protein
MRAQESGARISRTSAYRHIRRRTRVAARRDHEVLNLTAVNEETSSQPTWWGWRDALAVVARPIYLKRTLATALAVGTVLFAINQLNVVLDGQATAVVWVKTGVTYLVPFVVSNIGVLIATRRPRT